MKKRSLSHRTKSGFKVFLIIVITAVVAVVAASSVIMTFWTMDNKMPAFSNGGELHIYEGDEIEDVIARMQSMGILHPSSLERALNIERSARRLHPGSYVFKPTHTARYVARAITMGWQTPVKLVISGPIRSKAALASKISSQMMVDSLSIINALNDSLLLDKYGTTPSHVFEIILPDTYELYWDWDAEKIINKLKKEYDLYWNKDRRSKAEAQGLTPGEVSILASIVAEESNRADEYPKIASVYLTRLKKGMKLQACPTVCYIYDFTIRRVLYSHLANPSPYNTYLYEGLPPTPICVPEKVHIEAVLNPDSHNYLYFCADSSFNGRNVFAETYSQHQVNAAKYHKALSERKERKDDSSSEMMSSGAVIPESE